MKNYDTAILNKLIDKYEKSKSFIGTNTVNQRFSIKIVDLFPRYADEAEYDIFISVNEAVKKLNNLGIVQYKAQKNDVILSVILNCEAIDNCYTYLKRVPKKSVNTQLVDLLNKYKDCNAILSLYCGEQLKRISENKAVQHFDNDFVNFENLLKALSEVVNVQNETFQRDFSVRIFGDSKAFEKIKSKVVSVLYEYGDFPEKETILEDLNIIRNPGHVYFKGCGKITINKQTIDFSDMNGDLAISSSLLQSIESVVVSGNSVMTIENLTTFNAFFDKNVFAIYLGGYHNTDRRNFIKKVYEQNPGKQFWHYGDIDAGGFYILQHLCKKTNISFKPFNMDVATLQKYAEYTKPLTENDKKRLRNLMNSDYRETIEYMLENNCKLEQEILDT